MKEILRGHLDECLKHYQSTLDAKAPPRTSNAMKVREPIARFCGVQPEAIARWFKGFSPVGITYLKTMCFLDLMGYRVIELERRRPVFRAIIEMIAYQAVPIEEIMRLTGYLNYRNLHRVVLEKTGCSKEMENRMWDLMKGRRTDLEAKKLEAQVQFLPFAPVPEPEKKEVPTPAPVKAHGSNGTLGKIVNGLIALLDNVSDEELRTSDMVRKLSARLNALSPQSHSQET